MAWHGPAVDLAPAFARHGRDMLSAAARNERRHDANAHAEGEHASLERHLLAVHPTVKFARRLERCQRVDGDAVVSRLHIEDLGARMDPHLILEARATAEHLPVACRAAAAPIPPAHQSRAIRAAAAHVGRRADAELASVANEAVVVDQQLLRPQRPQVGVDGQRIRREHVVSSICHRAQGRAKARQDLVDPMRTVELDGHEEAGHLR